jgi:hypothetical protein
VTYFIHPGKNKFGLLHNFIRPEKNKNLGCYIASSILERTKSWGCYKTSSILEEKNLGRSITSSILEWALWTATNFIHLGKNKSGYYITSSILERTTWASSLLHKLHRSWREQIELQHNFIHPGNSKVNCYKLHPSWKQQSKLLQTSSILETAKWTATNFIHPGNSKVGWSRAYLPVFVVEGWRQ